MGSRGNCSFINLFWIRCFCGFCEEPSEPNTSLGLNKSNTKEFRTTHCFGFTSLIQMIRKWLYLKTAWQLILPTSFNIRNVTFYLVLGCFLIFSPLWDSYFLIFILLSVYGLKWPCGQSYDEKNEEEDILGVCMSILPWFTVWILCLFCPLNTHRMRMWVVSGRLSLPYHLER